VTADELFLQTLDDLRERVKLGKGEYDLMNAAWLLRKLLLEGEPLVHAVNRSRGLKIRYRLNDIAPPPDAEHWHAYDTFYPDPWPESRPIDVKHDAFLRRVILVASRERITVHDLIDFIAHHYGAVHASPAEDAKTKALRDDAWGRRVTMVEGQYSGQYSGPVYALRAVASVVLVALEPLAQEVRRNAGGELLPEYLRGLRKHADPNQRDVRLR
jgi:hypothetical protein